MRRQMMAIVAVIVGLCVILSGCGGGGEGEEAQTPQEFYQGKTMTVIVETKAGGGTDYLARVLAKYLKDELGLSKVIVENQEPKLDAKNKFMHENPNGLYIMASDASPLVGDQLTKAPGLAYDFGDFEYIGAIAMDVNAVAVAADSPLQTVDDFAALQNAIIGGTSYWSGVEEAVTCELLNMQTAKVIYAYAGASESVLAVARGEIDAAWSSLAGMKAFEDQGYVKVLFVVDHQRNPLAPDVPAIVEYTPGFSTEQERLLDFVIAGQPGKVYYCPPGTPQDRLDYLRAAFDRITANPDYVADVEKDRNIEPIVSGEDFQAILNSVAQTPASVIDQTIALLDKYRA